MSLNQSFISDFSEYSRWSWYQIEAKTLSVHLIFKIFKYANELFAYSWILIETYFFFPKKKKSMVN